MSFFYFKKYTKRNLQKILDKTKNVFYNSTNSKNFTKSGILIWSQKNLIQKSYFSFFFIIF